MNITEFFLGTHPLKNYNLVFIVISVIRIILIFFSLKSYANWELVIPSLIEDDSEIVETEEYRYHYLYGGKIMSNRYNISNILLGIHCPTETLCIVVGYNGTIINSTDGGVTWAERVSSTNNVLWDVYCPTLESCIAVGDSGTAIRSIDNGVTWNHLNLGTHNALRGIHCSTSELCIIVGDNGTIIRTDDGGISWNEYSLDIYNDFFDIHCPTSTLCIAVGGIYFLCEPDGPIVKLGACWKYGASKTIIRSTDGGISWTIINNWVYNNWVYTGRWHLKGIYCITSKECIAISEEIVIKSIDEGETWRVIGRSYSDNPNDKTLGLFKSIYCLTSNLCIAANQRNRILISNDGGVTWKIQKTNMENDDSLYNISCSPKSCFAIGSENTILTKNRYRLSLPELEKEQAFNTTIKSTFKGGVSIGKEYYTELSDFSVSLGKAIDIYAEIEVNNIHVGKKADIIVVFRYISDEHDAVEEYYVLDEERNILSWDFNLDSLKSFKKGIYLTEIQSINIYNGTLLKTGVVNVYFGYRLLNGTIIFNKNQTIQIKIF